MGNILYASLFNFRLKNLDELAKFYKHISKVIRSLAVMIVMKKVESGTDLITQHGLLCA